MWTLANSSVGSQREGELSPVWTVARPRHRRPQSLATGLIEFGGGGAEEARTWGAECGEEVALVV